MNQQKEDLHSKRYAGLPGTCLDLLVFAADHRGVHFLHGDLLAHTELFDGNQQYSPFQHWIVVAER